MPFVESPAGFFLQRSPERSPPWSSATRAAVSRRRDLSFASAPLGAKRGFAASLWALAVELGLGRPTPVDFEGRHSPDEWWFRKATGGRPHRDRRPRMQQE
jgi:hypothetical protein